MNVWNRKVAFVLMVYQKHFFFKLAFSCKQKDLLVVQNNRSVCMQQRAIFNFDLLRFGFYLEMHKIKSLGIFAPCSP